MNNLLSQKLFNAAGAGGGFSDKGQVDLMDSSSTSLPVGQENPSADGVALANYMQVLYTNLSDASQNNRVYTVQGIGNPNLGASFTLDTQGTDMDDGLPSPGDMRWVKGGSSNGQSLQGWNGSAYEKLLCNPAGILQVTNSASASSSVGSLSGKIQVFDANGNSLGYVPLYASIS